MRSKLWQFISVVVVTVMLASVLIGCAGPEPATEEPAAPTTAAGEATEAPTEEPTEEEPVTLRIGANYLVDTINPTVGWRNWPLRELWYDSPVEWTGTTNVEPSLAETWDTSDDGLVWTFKIREGVTFHDGTPCTAHEVAWTLNWFIENRIPTQYIFIYPFTEVVALDETTLQITTEEPLATMISLALIYSWVLPPHIWEDMTPEEAMESTDLSVTIGTGPYKVVDYAKDEYMIMEANENYWRGKPEIDRIVWQVYPNPDAMLQALLAGEIDLVGIYEPVPATSVETLQQAEDVEVLFGLGYKVNHLVINSYEDGTQPESLWDPAVRLAMAHAIDKEKIVDVAYLGYATPATSVLPPAVGDYVNSDLVDIPFDIEAGNIVLDDAGYVDSDGDGVREYSDGTPLEYRLYGLEGGTTTRIVEIIAEGLAQVGIKANVTVMKQDSMQALYPAHDFDLVSRSWFIDPDPDFLLSIFTCGARCISQEECGWSDSGYCDPAFDEMYYQQATLLDREERRELIWEMQEKIFNDRPYIVLFYGQDIIAYNSDRFTFDPEVGNMRLRSAITHDKILPNR